MMRRQSCHACANGDETGRFLNGEPMKMLNPEVKRTMSALLLCAVAVSAATLSACGNKDKKPGQALASVDGKEVTVLQLNDELQRAGVKPAQLDAAKKQLLDVLVERQLVLNAAEKEQVARDPVVMQAIERAKAQIITQAYVQKRISALVKPSEADVSAYYNKHPELFAQRRQFDLRQLVIDSSSLTAEARAAIDGAKSLEDVAAWFDAHQVKYARAQLARTSTDLPADMNSKLLAMSKGQLFIVREGERSLIVALNDIREAPLALAAAAPQIGQFLINTKVKEATEAEVKRLRASAKVEYFNQADAPKPVAAAPAASVDPAAKGVAGLK